MAQAVQHVDNREIAHSDRQVGIDQTQKLPAHREKEEIPISNVKRSETKLTTEAKGNRLPVTFRHENPPSLTVASQYSSYNSASIGMPIIRKALNSLVIVKMCRELQPVLHRCALRSR